MFIFVPLPFLDSIFIPSPSFSQSFLQRYKPIPVDFPNSRPFSPVKPLSNTLTISFSLIPIPLSSMVKTIFDLFLAEYIFITEPFSFEYFNELLFDLI